MPRIVAGNDQLNVGPLGGDPPERLDHQRDILVGLPLAEIEEIRRPDAKVPLPGCLPRRIAERLKAAVRGLGNRHDPLPRVGEAACDVRGGRA